METNRKRKSPKRRKIDKKKTAMSSSRRGKEEANNEPEPMDTEEDRPRGETSGGGGSGSGSQRFADSALQGLLKKLGAGLEDLLPTAGGSGSGSHHGIFGGHSNLFTGSSSMSHRLKPILVGLKSFDDEQRQLGALTELCDVLTVSSEETLVSAFSCESFLPPLVDLLRCEHNPDVALFAGRALTTLADLMPPRMAVAGMLRLGAADAFCAKLMCVEYIDVAEQSLQAMEKITSAGEDHAAVCMRAGGVQAVLSFLDFFQTGVQRVAVRTAANMLACVSSRQDVAMIKDAIPILVNLLSYEDDKIVEHAFLGLARALKAMCTSHSVSSRNSKGSGSIASEYVQIILQTKILEEVTKLLQVSEFGSMHSSLSASSYYEAVRSLSKCCGGSPLLAERALALDVPVICTRLLQSFSVSSASSASATPATTPGATPPPSSSVMSPIMSPTMRSTENTLSILKLVDSMLPEISENPKMVAIGPGGDAKQLTFSSSPTGGVSSHPIAHSDDQQSGGGDAKVVNIVETKASVILLPTLFEMVSSTLAYQLKQICVLCIKKLLVHSSPNGLEEVLRNLPASSTVMGLLSSKEASVQLDAIFLALVLLEKLPGIFVRYFMKEGVLFGINQIVEGAGTDPSTPGGDPGTEAEAIEPGASSGRRERRRSRTKANAPSEAAFTTPTTSNLKSRVIQAAKDFQSRYAEVSSDFGVDAEALPAKMDQLRALAKQIEAGETSAVATMLEEVASESGGISSFELVHAGLDKALLAYFSAENSAEPQGRICYELTRKFAECFARRPNGEDVFRTLLKRLHEIVSSRERLPVLACKSRPPASSSVRYLFFERGGSGGGWGDRSKEVSGLAALAHPFKLRFVRKEGETQLRDYAANVVLVEPLSTFEVIEDFLRARVELPHGAALGARADSGRREQAGRRSTTAASGGEATPVPGESNTGTSKSTGILTRSKSKLKQEEEEDSTKAAPKPHEPSTSRRVTRSAARQEAEADEEMGDPDSDMEEEDPHHLEEEEDMDLLEEDMEEDDEDEDDDDDDAYDNHFRFRRESEVFEVDVAEDPDAGAGSANQTDAGPKSSPAHPATAGENYADKASGGSRDHHGLQFYLNGKPLSANSSVFQAVLQANDAFVNADDPQNARGGPSVWERVHTFTYCKRVATSSAVAFPSEESIGGGGSDADGGIGRVVEVSELVRERVLTRSSERQAGAMEPSENLDKEVTQALDLIDILTWLRGNHDRVYGPQSSPTFLFMKGITQEDLVSYRLSSKVMRQLQDLLIICGKCLPEWVRTIVTEYPMIFPFDLRRQYLHLTCLGVPHAIQHLLHQIPNGDSLRQELRDVRLVRNRRQKVRIDRKKLLQSAAKVMDLYGKSQATLEVEYFGEVGTGLGPTLEFYTLLSTELQRKSMNIWVSADGAQVGEEGRSLAAMSEEDAEEVDMADSDLIFGDMDSDANPQVGGSEPSPKSGESKGAASGVGGGRASDDYARPLGDGLFPKPKTRPDAQTLSHFKVLGTTFAKAIFDGRLLDISLSSAFWRRALGGSLGIHDLCRVDAQMSQSLVKLHQTLESDDPTHMDGCAIVDLGLYFTLPGDDDFELCDNGKNTAVTHQNLAEFLDKVLDAYFGSGTQKQFDKFREGFERVFPLSRLGIFTAEEIDTLACGQQEKWTVEMLTDCLKFDHGYTAQSPYVKQFLHILADFDAEHQRLFLKFVTGAPRLPPGGLNSLNPKLTIVRKNFTSTQSHQNTPRSESVHTPMTELVLENYDLPSVMTCANYVKLPPYTSQAVMREKLVYAMKEGQGAFNLS